MRVKQGEVLRKAFVVSRGTSGKPWSNCEHSKCLHSQSAGRNNFPRKNSKQTIVTTW